MNYEQQFLKAATSTETGTASSVAIVVLVVLVVVVVGLPDLASAEHSVLMFYLFFTFFPCEIQKSLHLRI